MSNGTTIIALGHRQRTGKNTVAEMLNEQVSMLGLRPGTYSFAALLKEMAYRMYRWAGLEPGLYYELNPEAKEEPLEALGLSPRQIYIELGMWGRSLHKDVWIRSTLASIDEEQPHVALITDLRFPNEAEILKERGARLVRIDRPNVLRSNDVADRALEGYEGWDHVLHNDSGLVVLEQRSRELLETILTPEPVQ